MYLLMNKDNFIASFAKVPSLFEDETLFEIKEKKVEALPIGFLDINTWLEGRKASKHNEHLKEIMERLGCAESEGFIKTTHATSINDTFWVKREDESVTWDNVSLYRNEFTESISALALEGVGLYNGEFSSTGLPEFVSDGSFPKCFKKEDSDIFIYKGGTRKAFNAGKEPYCEVMASEIAKCISPKSVDYQLSILHDRLASKCQLFTDEIYGYVPFRSFMERGKVITLDHAFHYFEQRGSEDLFREMLLIDALTFNTDRHAGNYGAIIRNETLEFVHMAPIFDLNLSLFPYLLDNEFDYIGDNMLRYSPALGTDFTRLGQQVLTPRLRDKLLNFTDFQFSFNGDEKFSRARVKQLEVIVSKQADAILSRQKLKTQKVFVPETAHQQKINAKQELPNMTCFADRIDELNLPISVSLCNDSNRAAVIVEPDVPGSHDFLFEFDFLHQTSQTFVNFQSITLFIMEQQYPEFYHLFEQINQLFQQKQYNEPDLIEERDEH